MAVIISSIFCYDLISPSLLYKGINKCQTAVTVCGDYRSGQYRRLSTQNQEHQRRNIKVLINYMKITIISKLNNGGLWRGVGVNETLVYVTCATFH